MLPPLYEEATSVELVSLPEIGPIEVARQGAVLRVSAETDRQLGLLAGTIEITTEKTGEVQSWELPLSEDLLEAASDVPQVMSVEVLCEDCEGGSPGEYTFCIHAPDHPDFLVLGRSDCSDVFEEIAGPPPPPPSMGSLPAGTKVRLRRIVRSPEPLSLEQLDQPSE